VTDHPIHPNLRDALDGPDEDAEALDAIVRRLGGLGPDAMIQPPPPGLFAAIEAELARGATEPPAAEVVELAPRRSRRVLVGALGAAAAVLIAATTAAIVREDEPAPTAEEVALDGLPDFADAAGSATVIVDGDARSVGVDLSGVEVPPGSHLELWLLDESVEQLVPLGRLSGAAPHDIPADVDLAVTPIVDVSIEPDDGDPAHSGVSVVRGQIEAS
jgi:hypothetical protein